MHIYPLNIDRIANERGETTNLNQIIRLVSIVNGQKSNHTIDWIWELTF